MHYIDNVLIYIKRSTAKAQARWHKTRLGVCGSNLTIQNDSVFTDPGSVFIGDNVWIGANVTVLSGVVIHTGAVVGAGSTVTHDVPTNTIVAGVPAKVIRKRKASGRPMG